MGKKGPLMSILSYFQDLLSIDPWVDLCTLRPYKTTSLDNVKVRNLSKTKIAIPLIVRGGSPYLDPTKISSVNLTDIPFVKVVKYILLKNRVQDVFEDHREALLNEVMETEEGDFSSTSKLVSSLIAHGREKSFLSNEPVSYERVVLLILKKTDELDLRKTMITITKRLGSTGFEFPIASEETLDRIKDYTVVEDIDSFELSYNQKNIIPIIPILTTRNEIIGFDQFNFQNHNIFISGDTGTGKTVLLKHILLSSLQANRTATIFDTFGEFTHLSKELKGSPISLKEYSLNPFEIYRRLTSSKDKEELLSFVAILLIDLLVNENDSGKDAYYIDVLKDSIISGVEHAAAIEHSGFREVYDYLITRENREDHPAIILSYIALAAKPLEPFCNPESDMFNIFNGDNIPHRKTLNVFQGSLRKFDKPVFTGIALWDSFTKPKEEKNLLILDGPEDLFDGALSQFKDSFLRTINTSLIEVSQTPQTLTKWAGIYINFKSSIASADLNNYSDLKNGEFILSSEQMDSIDAMQIPLYNELI